MFFFNKNKDNEIPVSKPSAPASSPISKPIDPDDFFKDMGRKPKPKKFDMSIAVPEITGLRDEPLPPPGSRINNIDTPEEEAQRLRDKNLMPDVFTRGDIRTADLSNVDTETMLIDRTDPEAVAAYERAKDAMPSNPVSADDFFRDIDRRRKNRKVDISIDLPEVTGLRERPEEAPVSNINNLDTELLSTDRLRDKSADPRIEGYADINVVDLSRIDLSGLREEKEEEPEPEDMIIVE